MIVIVSQRIPFIDNWRTAVSTVSSQDTFAVLPIAGFAALVAGQPVPDPVERLRDEARMVILDLAAVAGDRAGFVRTVKSRMGTIPVILGGDHFDPDRELAALSLGVSACCDEGNSPEMLMRILQAVSGGGVWISGGALPRLMARLSGRAGEGTPTVVLPAAKSGTSSLNQLTDRQRAVAELVANGANNKEIARQLNIADRTVKAHLTAIFEKFGVSDRVQLAIALNRR